VPLSNKPVTSEDEAAIVKRKGSTRRKQTPPIQSPESEGGHGTATAPPSPIRKLITNVDTAISNAMPSSQALVQAAEKTGFRLQKRAHSVLKRSRKVRLSSIFYL